MAKTFLIVTGLLVAITSPVFAQQPTFHDALLDHLVGNWVLRGTIVGKRTTHDVAAEWVLGHQYLQLSETSRSKDSKGKADYQAKVFIGWDKRASRYVCLWLDTYGGIFTQSFGHARRAGDSLRFLFDDGPHDEVFQTTFAFDQHADSWSWRLDSERAGALTPFARLRMTRKR